jgi:hypothetical protein
MLHHLQFGASSQKFVSSFFLQEVREHDGSSLADLQQTYTDTVYRIASLTFCYIYSLRHVEK